MSAYPKTAQQVKDETLEWLKDRFEVPDAVWLPGLRQYGRDCPIANVLTNAGYKNVWVGHSLIRYETGGTLIRVRLPERIALFPKWFDKGRYPELVIYKLVTRPLCVPPTYIGVQYP